MCSSNKRPQNVAALLTKDIFRDKRIFLSDLTFVLREAGRRGSENREINIDQQLLVRRLWQSVVFGEKDQFGDA